QHMSKNDIGALIIVCPTNVPNNVIETGTRLDSLLSAEVLECIFNNKSPLHDGAVVVKNNVIIAAGCFLPLSQDPTISKELGTRHRAAVGITEESDVVAIVVSEETGIISVMRRGEIKRYMTSDKLMEILENTYGINYISRKSERRSSKR
ncbi:MAG: TIGR00159 family protein, partial [Clostridia bacterium]|nr:TIGR00159 family protein [Clostridia bacterium]